MTYELDSGKRFGLPPIGLPESNLSTSGSDTERRAMPGLATKNSVFAWNSTLTQLVNTGAVNGSTGTINLRNNTATSGLSVDVPTWAAGAVVIHTRFAQTMGTSTYHNWLLNSSITSGSIPMLSVERNAASNVTEYTQVIIPFYDEPVFTFGEFTNGTGAASTIVYLLGFVRNV